MLSSFCTCFTDIRVLETNGLLGKRDFDWNFGEFDAEPGVLVLLNGPCMYAMGNRQDTETDREIFRKNIRFQNYGKQGYMKTKLGWAISTIYPTVALFLLDLLYKCILPFVRRVYSKNVQSSVLTFEGKRKNKNKIF